MRRTRPSIPRLLARLVTVIAVSAALILPTQVAAAAVESPGDQPVAGARSPWYWEWSDGSVQERREFSKRVYGYAANLPYLRVQDGGCSYGQVVKLQWKNSYGRWVTEATARTKGCKAVKLRLYPYTSSGAWARGIYKYRIIVSGSGGISQYLTVIYSR